MISILILIVTFSIGFILFFVVRKRGQKDFRKHQEQLALYAEEFQVHKKQIKKRMMSLNKYDLLTYNLSESLMVQHQIKL
ncbi:hypothetical protein [uncultured Dokdonia sp.]|uniref:hypothetical protein n=1 Tax=uncultured Dokdonia sp. TaxID=575653 RepID=UPI002610DAB6|nr:hypothetical protein [uncultured Dokdonia sp.]